MTVNELLPDDPRHIGRYRLLGRLGRGGMGTVYLGEDPGGQRVAVKVINSEYSQHEQFRERFRREAEAARRVRRFCTVAVLDSALEGDQLYVVTEYVEGRDLEETVRASGPLRGSSLDALAVGVATALTAIHGAGIVHRDLKPSNVLLSPVGPRVIDFGIARALDTLGGVTRTGEIIGTPRYMAPEVLRGEQVSPACDVFSWGCLVTFAGTGRSPFGTAEGPLPMVLYQILNNEPALDGLEEPNLRELVRAALAKDPAQRPTAQQLLDSMVGMAGRVPPERAEHSVARAWRQDAAAPPALGTDALVGSATGTVPYRGGAPSPGDPAHRTRTQETRPRPAPPGAADGAADGAGATRPGTPGDGTVPAPPPTRAEPAAVPAGAPSPTGPGPGGAPARPANRRNLAIGLGVAVPLVLVLAAVAVRLMAGPGGPPDDLVQLYAEDFTQSDTGWGRRYDNGRYSSGYTSDGRYAIDADGSRWRSENRVRAPIPFVIEQPATPSPSSTPAPTIPERLLIGVDAATEQATGTGEYGLYCRDDGADKSSRYEFLLDTSGRARIRKVSQGSGGNIAEPVKVEGLTGTARLQASCEPEGSAVRLTMWVDGEQVHSVLDDVGLRSGSVGVITRVPTGGDSVLKMRFDNFTLHGPKPGEAAGG